MTIGFELELPGIELRQYVAGERDSSKLPMLSTGLHDKEAIFRTTNGLVFGYVEWGMIATSTSAILELVTAPIMERDIASDRGEFKDVLDTLDVLIDTFTKCPGAWHVGSPGQKTLGLQWFLKDSAFLVPSMTMDNVRVTPQVNFSLELKVLGRRIRQQRALYDPSTRERAQAQVMSKDELDQWKRDLKVLLPPPPIQRKKQDGTGNTPSQVVNLDGDTFIPPPLLGTPDSQQQKILDWCQDKLIRVLEEAPNDTLQTKERNILDHTVGFLWLALYMLRTESQNCIPGHQKNRYCWLPRSSIYMLAQHLDGLDRDQARQVWEQLAVDVAADETFLPGENVGLFQHRRDFRDLRPDLQKPSGELSKLLDGLKHDCVELFLLTVSHGLGVPSALERVQKAVGKKVKSEEFPAKFVDLTQVCETKAVDGWAKEIMLTKGEVVSYGPSGGLCVVLEARKVEDIEGPLRSKLEAWAKEAVYLDPPRGVRDPRDATRS